MSFLKQEFLDCLKELRLSQVEAAKLLSVTPRTLNRWAENPHEISGPAEQALRAWLRLQRYNLPWRPDGYDIGENDTELPEKIGILRNHSLHHFLFSCDIDPLETPKLPWKINLKEGIAKLETIEIRFYLLSGTGNCFFTIASCNRKDEDIDILRDVVRAIAVGRG